MAHLEICCGLPFQLRSLLFGHSCLPASDHANSGVAAGDPTEQRGRSYRLRCRGAWFHTRQTNPAARKSTYNLIRGQVQNGRSQRKAEQNRSGIATVASCSTGVATRWWPLTSTRCRLLRSVSRNSYSKASTSQRSFRPRTTMSPRAGRGSYAD